MGGSDPRDLRRFSFSSWYKKMSVVIERRDQDVGFPSSFARRTSVVTVSNQLLSTVETPGTNCTVPSTSYYGTYILYCYLQDDESRCGKENTYSCCSQDVGHLVMFAVVVAVVVVDSMFPGMDSSSSSHYPPAVLIHSDKDHHCHYLY